MSEVGDQDPTNLPDSRAEVAPRGYYVAAGFYPQLHLTRKSGFDFGRTLSDYIDPDKTEFGEDAWVYSQRIGGLPQSRLYVNVRAAQIEIGGEFLPHKQEWFEDRVGAVLQRFGQTLKPVVVLGSKAMLRGTLPINGDAREFVAKHVMKIDPKRVDSFGRPIHMVGLRLFLPSYVKRTGDQAEGTDWSVNVRVESLMEDPSQLFLEADAEWPGPMRWDESTDRKLVERLQFVGDYLRNNVIAFLRAPDGDQDMER